MTKNRSERSLWDSLLIPKNKTPIVGNFGQNYPAIHKISELYPIHPQELANEDTIQSGQDATQT